MKTDNPTKGSAIGIDFGGTSVKIGSLSQLLSEEKNNVKSLKTSDFETVDSLISAMVEVVNEFREKEEIITVGCGVPGLVDFDNGHIHMLTNVPGWNDIAVKDIMQKELNLPVHVDNDANCICLLYTSPSPRDLSTSRMPSSA